MKHVPSPMSANGSLPLGDLLVLEKDVRTMSVNEVKSAGVAVFISIT